MLAPVMPWQAPHTAASRAPGAASPADAGPASDDAASMQTNHAFFMPESNPHFLVPELYMSRYSMARFLKSAVSPATFGDESGFEVATAGRSNSGKSSALNAIVRQRDLARTSRTPGRTQAANLFELETGRRPPAPPG